MRYLAVISYFGAAYCGWQKQLNAVSVQEVTEKALSAVFHAPTQAVASGRTDAGVHAEGQVIHFDADTSIPPEKIPYAVNTELPEDVSMLYCEIAPENFSARFSAKKKTYRYDAYLSRHRLPLLSQTAAHVVVPLDLCAMKAAAEKIEGTHDFACFEAAGSTVKNTVRTVYSVIVETAPLNADFGSDYGVSKCEKTSETVFGKKCSAKTKECRVYDCRLSISVTGNGFLYNMVRIIAGTLVYAGMGKLSADDIEAAILSGDRTKAGKTLPPEGLHLVKVEY